MDDQNQTNQPLDQNANPGIPSAPEDITPRDTIPMQSAPTPSTAPEQSSPMVAPAEPMTASEPTDLYTTSQPAAPIPTTPVEPIQTPTSAAETPFSSPADVAAMTTETPEIPAPTTIAGEQPVQTAPTEPTLPEAKPKKKILPVIGGVVALLLVAGVAGAAYYVSNQLSARQAVAPTAPESKPMASEGGYCGGQATGCGTCYTVSGSCVKSCSKCGDTAGSYWTYCDSNACSGGGGGGDTCGGSGQPACGIAVSGGQANNCPSAPFTYGCGMQCCNTDAHAVCCCTGCFPAGTDCSQHTCAPAPACGDANNPKDDRITAKIKFSKAGKITLFTRNMVGTVTLTGPKTVTINSTDAGAAVKQGTTFTVNANEEYSIQVKLSAASEKGNPSYGWIANKAATKCGPVKTPGEPLDANSKATGKCGVDADIASLVSLASANSEVAGITAGATAANVQCWGDALQSDATQDYDFNDFTLVFGYEKEAAVVGACTTIKVYKKVDGVYGTTPLTKEQLKALKVNDVLKFELNSSVDNLKGRFRVTHNGTEAGNWLTGTIDATNKKLVTYSDYTVAAAGTYTFEAQVTTKP